MVIDGSDKTAGAWTAESIVERIIRYDDMKPFGLDFVDTRTRGSGPETPAKRAKQYIMMISPRVSGVPVHMKEPHGFNIVGVRQPPQLVNSQHSHDTAEVWVVHTGRWRISYGEHGDDAQVEIGPGDVISTPTRSFRGFMNIGEEVGFLWSVTGNDEDPGIITWAPSVFEQARDVGVTLLNSGRLIDTFAGEEIPPGDRPLPPTTREEANSYQRFTQQEAEGFVARAPVAAGSGERLIIGPGAAIGWPHGFTLCRLGVESGESVPMRHFTSQEVIFVHSGELQISWPGGAVCLKQGDTMSVPEDLPHSIFGKEATVAFIVRRDDATGQ